MLELLVRRPWLTGRVTAACLVRKVDDVRPTLLLDESDAAFNGEKEYAEALRGILNTGFYVDGVASCCVGQGTNISYKDFHTYCAKAIAGIGNLPDTVADRSIPIRLMRKRKGETVARFRKRYAKSEALPIRDKLARWVESIVDRLKNAEPALPERLTDRQQDAIEPLLAIADEAAKDWPEAVRTAAMELFGSTAAEDQDVGVQLLADMKDIFEADGEGKMFTTDLLGKLKEIETSPWADWQKGKGLTAHAMSRLLRRFDVSPTNIRRGDTVNKGYDLDRLTDAFSRYLVANPSESDFQSATSLQPASLLSETHFSEPLHDTPCSGLKSASDPHKYRQCSDVAFPNPVSEGLATNEVANEGRRMPSCEHCGSFDLFRERDGAVVCQSCGNRKSRTQ